MAQLGTSNISLEAYAHLSSLISPSNSLSLTLHAPHLHRIDWFLESVEDPVRHICKRSSCKGECERTEAVRSRSRNRIKLHSCFEQSKKQVHTLLSPSVASVDIISRFSLHQLFDMVLLLLLLIFLALYVNFHTG
jgi:hypothetical protein